MTLTVYEFTDVAESGDPLYPPVRRRVTQALSNTYISIGETAPVRAVLVYNDSSTTGIHLRIGTASSGENADQSDPYIGPDESAFFMIARKRRTTAETTDRIYINAVADT